MAVIVAENNVNLSTVNGYTRTLYDNFAMFSTTELSISTARTISFTPSAAEDCKGVVLALRSQTSAVNMKSVTVELRESGIVRATVTYTAAQITNMTAGSADSCNGIWIMPFIFTTPYAVTAVAGTWDIRIVGSGTGGTDFTLRTSNGTAPFSVVIGSTAVSYVDNTDQIVAIGKVTLDQNFTLLPKLGTGITDRPVCAVACRTTTPEPDNVANFLWGTSASITGNISGLFVLSAHSGFRAGTQAAPITIANKGILNINRSAVGTQPRNSGFSSGFHSGATNQTSRNSLFFYGEIPAVEDTTFTAGIALGATSLTTAVATNWVNGDEIYIGKSDVEGMGDANFYTVTSTVGTTVNFTPALATYARKSGGSVVRMNGYGFEIIGSNVSNGLDYQYVGELSNMVFSGVRKKYVSLLTVTNGGVSGEKEIYRSGYTIKNCSDVALVAANLGFGFNISPNENPTIFDQYNICRASVPSIGAGGSNNASITFSNCLFLSPGMSNGSGFSLSTQYNSIFYNCKFENNNISHSINGSNGIIQNCYFWGSSGGNDTIRFNTWINGKGINNTFEKCAAAWQLAGVVIHKEINPTLINMRLRDIDATTGAYYDFLIESPNSNIVTTNVQSGNPTGNIIINGSILRIVEENNVANADRDILAFGKYTRCGTALADTTVRTSPGYSIRIDPSSTASGTVVNFPNREEERTFPIGNIQNKTMTVSIWVKINNPTNFKTAPYTLPTLYVKHDNATIVSTVAIDSTSDWQRLAIVFTPVTTYGQIETWVSMASTATGTDAYVYLDDWSLSYPPGTAVDLGTMDLWANGTPVWPPIATVPLPGSVWDVQTSEHGTTAGSYGMLNKDTNIKADDATVFSIIK